MKSWLLLVGLASVCVAQTNVSKPRMPDPELTKGAVAITDENTLCAKTFRTGDERYVTETMKEEVYAAYHIKKGAGICAIKPVPTKKGGTVNRGCEIDHLISLEIGGSNDLDNLWPQPYTEHPGAGEKDVLEKWLNRQVCKTHTMTLAQAQEAIRTDWYSEYQKMLADKSTQRSHTKRNRKKNAS